MLEISAILFNHLGEIFLQTTLQMVKMSKAFVLFSLFFLLGACMEDEKPVTLGISLIDKKITMTSSSVNELTVEVYLTSEDAAEGQLLAKAMNLQGQEIGRSSQNLSLGKDDAKLIAFTFDASVEMDSVAKIVIDLRKE